jgi:hypothetical protein
MTLSTDSIAPNMRASTVSLAFNSIESSDLSRYNLFNWLWYSLWFSKNFLSLFSNFLVERPSALA